jgi:hypothetical protein
VQHDDLVAVVSHVPHLAAATLMRIADNRSEEHMALLRLAAGGFRDMTRIASGRPGIWLDICEQNKSSIVRGLDALILGLTDMRDVVASLEPNVPSYVSVFAGRIADTGRDPVPVMAAAVEMLKMTPASELIWASPRELLNIYQADEVGCQIITVTPDVIKKLSLIGYDLDAFSLDTVKMFYKDATEAGFKL